MSILKSNGRTSCCDAMNTYVARFDDMNPELADDYDAFVEVCKSCFNEIIEHEGVAR